jgi:hypothetical protein
MGVAGPPSKADGVLSPATSEVLRGVELQALNTIKATDALTIHRCFVCFMLCSFAL